LQVSSDDQSLDVQRDALKAFDPDIIVLEEKVSAASRDGRHKLALDTTTAAGELILTVFAGVATFERKRIKERQREGIEAAKRKGIYRGGKKRFDDAAIWALADAGLGATAIMREVGAKSTATSIVR